MIAKRLFAEGLGTAMLLIGVVGSGIMAEALSGGNVGIALLNNAIATGCMLYAIITTLDPVSGAHFNPAVTLAFALHGEHPWHRVLPYVAAQILGGVRGVWAAHVMFDLPVLQLSGTMHRTGVAQWFSEILTTFGLLFVIFGGVRHRPDAVPPLVGFYITGAYGFTASTGFANPSVTIARGCIDTFAGINPGHIPMFILMQIIAVGIAMLVLPWLFEK
ncbi:aquaporin [Sedimentitalea sp. HM32M-2]|uniref:aquaporin n=1 Tax=Sedimentitalea sp. HM32M-2 TaxID=3351566 RepID=UPI003643F096